MPSFIYNNYSVIFLVLSLPVGGIIGAWARLHITPPASETSGVGAGVNYSIKTARALLPGVAAAFAVPVLLSIGDSNIIENVVSEGKAGERLESWLVIFGFCVLAGTAAPSFIDSLARRALELAQQNKQEIESSKAELEQQKDLVAEAVENVPQRPQMESASVEVNRKDLSPLQREIVDAMLNSRFALRTTTAIARELERPVSDVRISMSELMREGYVRAQKSAKTGADLYSLDLANLAQ